jgi:carboxyl-terminal processing protease
MASPTQMNGKQANRNRTNRSRLLFLGLSILLVLPLVAGTLLAASGKDVDDGDSFFKYLTVFTEVLTRVRENYVDPPDVDQLLAGALDGTTDALDPFSVYVPADAVPAYFAARQVGTSHSGLLLLKEHGVLYIAGVAPGSPGEAAGFELGDLVAEMGGELTRVMPLWHAQQILAGPAGTKLDVKVIRLGEVQHLSLTLAPFTATPPAHSEQRGVSVIKVGSFDGSTLAAMEAALTAAAKAGRDKLALDLRGVVGGDAAVAFAVAGLFTGGDLGTLQRRGTAVETFRGREQAAWQGKVAVLTDRGTLGAAEVLATVLRQRIGAQLVGERTFGYSGRQELAELSSGGRLLYTDAFYAGPDGKPVRESLVPDLRVDREFPDGGAGQGAGAGAKDEALESAFGLLLGEVPVKKAA